MSIFFFFQSGTKKTLKPVVSDEIVNEAKAKVCNTAPGWGWGWGCGVINKCLNTGRLCPCEGCNPHSFVYTICHVCLLLTNGTPFTNLV